MERRLIVTGREMIIYILANGLEDEEVIKDGRIMGFIRDDDLAVQLGYGPSTVKALIVIGDIPNGVNIDDRYFVPLTKLNNK